MEEKKEKKLPTPKLTPEDEATQTKPQPKPKQVHAWQVAGLVLFCFAASFLGAWAFLATGLVQYVSPSALTENRETLVLQEGEIVAEVFEKVSPSTVAVIGQAPDSPGLLGQAPDLPASGIILSADGYIITNKHVVPEGVSRATVVLHDGTEYTNVRVIGRDPSNDIAFLKLEGVNGLKPAALGDSSQLKPGQQVVAIGNALGEYRNSVSTGIISGIGRPIEALNSSGNPERLENLLQTDAAINPGNSGGPLVNLHGEVIGINTATSTEGEAISFAIPINDVKGVIDSVLQQGKIVKPYLGVRYLTLDRAIADELNLPVNEGALLRGGNGQPAVAPGSAADKAGLRTGDIITKVNGQELGQSSLASKLAQFKPGDKLELTVLRGNNEQTVTVTLAEYPL